MREITSGLKFMSEHSVCHGDLKPENVLIDVRESQFVVKLCDFALSSHFDGSTSMVNKEFCGTPGFFAPEVLVEKQYW
jgi:calcium-dependent protein kinase